MGKVRRLAEDVEALRAEEADEKKVLTMMMMERVMMFRTTRRGKSERLDLPEKLSTGKKSQLPLCQ